jgi:hypothetical protein
MLRKRSSRRRWFCPSLASTAALPKLRFGSQPMLFGSPFRAAFFFPNFLRPARNFLAHFSDRIIPASRYPDPRSHRMSALFLAEGVVDRFHRGHRIIGRVTTAGNRISAILGQEEEEARWRRRIY